MEFLGVGPWELFIVIVIALVVVGPERLPVLARQAGKFLVTARDWVQKSPDAAMILRARAEIEQELANLRSSLAEVQGVRDEVMEATKQLNTVITQDVIAPARESLESITQTGTVARATKPNGLPAYGAEPASPIAAPAALDAPALIATDGSTLIEVLPADAHVTIAPPRAVTVTHAPADAPPQELALVLVRLDALAAELHLLQVDLRLRGLIDPPAAAVEPAAMIALVDIPLRDQELTDMHRHEDSLLAEPDGTPQSPIGEETDDVEQPVYSRD